MSEEKMASSSIEAEYMDIANKHAWPFVYQKLGRLSHSTSYPITEAKKPQNKPLNRYRDVNPYDHSRIILQRIDVDYINANLVKLERANRRYILTQGPLAFTVEHFWLMVWEQRSVAILMLNKIVEKSELKCHPYWPNSESEKMELHKVGLSVHLISCEDSNYYCTRRFRVTDTASQESRIVIQFHYTTWPDFGVPGSPVAFLKFLEHVRVSGALEPAAGPAIVHCSAGIGRSGTFCLVDSCLVIIENEGLDSVNVQEILLELRKDRMGLIQTPDQLRFSYQAIIEGAKRLDPQYVATRPIDPALVSELLKRLTASDVVQVRPLGCGRDQRLNVPSVAPDHLYFTDIQESAESEDIYSTVAEEEAPPPPPRVASLAGRRPPGRPLPAIPASVSADDLNLLIESASSSESEESAPTPPRRCSPYPSCQSDDDDTPIVDDDDDALTDDDDDDADAGAVSGSETAGVRRRHKDIELRERIIAMKRRARDAEWWQEFKRFKSMGKPKENKSPEG